MRISIKAFGHVFLVLSGFASLPALAFQFEATGLFGTGDNRNVDIDTFTLSGRYYLRPVDSVSGPLSELPFLDKAASVSASFQQIKPEFGSDSDVFGIEGRFVTQANYIVEVGYDTQEIERTNQFGNSVSEDSDTILIGGGLYLDDRADAVLTLKMEDDAGFDTNTLTARTRRINDGTAAGTYWGYEGAFSFIDNDDDSGFGIEVGGQYFPTELLSIGGSLDYIDVGDVDGTDITIGAQYFVTNQIAASFAFTKLDQGGDDGDLIGLGVLGRF